MIQSLDAHTLHEAPPQRTEPHATRNGTKWSLSVPINQEQDANVSIAVGESERCERIAALYGVSLTAGQRLAGSERLPFGRPGACPPGVGRFAGLPNCAKRCEQPRRTRAGGRASLGGHRRRPGEAHVSDVVARQAERDGGEEQQPGPAVGRRWGTSLGRRPLERWLEAADGVLDRAAGDVRLP